MNSDVVKSARVCQCLSGGAIMKLTNRITNITKNNKGFSLLEVLVGVSIIGIISAIAVPTFQDYRETASLTASNSSLKNIVKAFNLCIATQSNLTGCKTKADLKIDCFECTINADTSNTQVCGHVSTTVGSSTFQACWDSANKVFNYGGAFKICYCKGSAGTNTGTGSCSNATSNAVALSPVKKCDKPDNCGIAAQHECKSGTSTGGTCLAGVCQQ